MQLDLTDWATLSEHYTLLCFFLSSKFHKTLGLNEKVCGG